MKLLIVSDSHGRWDGVQKAVEREVPDAWVHLGDGWRDAERVQEQYPTLPLEQVPGNCDLGRWESAERLCFFGGHPVFLCHGHTLGVKQSLLRASMAAREHGAELLLFGHTHQPLVDFHNGLWVMNPGSIGAFHGTYGVITLDECGIHPAIFDL